MKKIFRRYIELVLINRSHLKSTYTLLSQFLTSLHDPHPHPLNAFVNFTKTPFLPLYVLRTFFTQTHAHTRTHIHTYETYQALSFIMMCITNE